MNYDKINRLIAVHVMGWEIKAVDFKQDGSFYEAYFDEEGKRLGIVGAYEFNPSKYIQDAWLVVDKLRISIFPQLGEVSRNCKYFVECYSEDEKLGLCEAFGETAPLAICKVALRSKRYRDIKCSGISVTYVSLNCGRVR